MKRLIICADGTWNKPEENIEKDFPTNVLKVARAIRPVTENGIEQVVFYDLGVGSYYDPVKGGAFGEGLNKNVQDCYRFIVQNYNPGDELYFFGFSRGAYTVRSLCGFIYNCGILKRPKANLISHAFSNIYKSPDIHPRDEQSVNFRKRNAVEKETKVNFIGVWDTVGSLGIPFRMFGFLNEKHLFHDRKIGPNINCARHALAIDEMRDDFYPTIWNKKTVMDLKQVWFCGVHSDIGGGYKPDSDKGLLADIPLKWMIKEAVHKGLDFEDHITDGLTYKPTATKHKTHKGFYKVLGKRKRRILKHTMIHSSVKDRYDQVSSYRPDTLTGYINKWGWNNIEE